MASVFPNDEAIIRLVGALMLESNDEWAVARRYMSLETLARVIDNPTVRLPAVATCSSLDLSDGRRSYTT
jgi:transposase-like protein